MKTVSMLAAAALFAASAGSAVLAQTNPSAVGTATAPSSGEGAPSAATPAGKLSTVQVGPTTRRRPAKTYKRVSSSSANKAETTAPAKP